MTILNNDEPEKPLSEAEKLDMFAMQIVHLVGRIQHEKVPDDATSKAFVDIRQASNDEAIEAVKDLIRKDRQAWGEQVMEYAKMKINKYSIHAPRGYPKGTLARRQLLGSLDNWMNKRQRNQGEKD